MKETTKFTPNLLRVGVTGYIAQKFDEDEAQALIEQAYDYLEGLHPDAQIEIVSGLTSLGIPKIAYQIADDRDYQTVGIACSKARDYACFDVDVVIFEGDEWGEESELFLDSIDVLVRVGGGKQAHAEVAQARDKNIEVIEIDLESTIN